MLYFFGPSQMHVEHFPESYYRSCGTFRVNQGVFNENGKCSVKDFTQLAASMYNSYLYSMGYDIYRTIDVRGAFSTYGATAFIFFNAVSVLPVLIILGILNLIVLRHMRKEATDGGGPLVFHQLNVGCDIVAAFLSLSPDIFVIGNVATTIYHVFTGKLSYLICLYE